VEPGTFPSPAELWRPHTKGKIQLLRMPCRHDKMMKYEVLAQIGKAVKQVIVESWETVLKSSVNAGL
jgi:hypothetical protein